MQLIIVNANLNIYKHFFSCLKSKVTVDIGALYQHWRSWLRLQ